jgi:hypothetical protein
MTGRFDDRDTFIAALQPIIDRQLEIYNEDPDVYVRELPNRILSHFWNRPPNRKISLASLLAECLIATHRVPTASYIRKLTHPPSPDWPEDHTLWNALNDTDLRSTLP